jgi:hypothetical protein
MILFLSVIGLSILVGLASGGRLRRIERLQLRWWGLVLAGLALQFAPLPSGRAGNDLLVRIVVLSCSYCLLVAFAALNIRLPGMALALIGLVLNALAIVPNGGMPVSGDALVRSGQPEVYDYLVREGAAKHHLQTEDDILTPLGDVIPIGGPIHQVVSVGDVFVYAGIAWLIISATRGRTRVPVAPPRYQGKHRQQEAASSPPPPTAATTSGSAP